jgi:hypothetical protein
MQIPRFARNDNAGFVVNGVAGYVSTEEAQARRLCIQKEVGCD